MRIRLATCLLAITLVTGCATAPPKLDSTKPVEFSRSMWGPSLKQNGVVINEMSAFDELAKVSAAQKPAQSAKYLFWGSLVTAGAGGWFLGSGIVSKDQQGQKLATAAGLIGVSALLAHFQKNSMQEATDLYNDSFASKKKKSKLHIEPAFAPVAGGAVGGFHFVF